jgi:O-antigen ligase
MTLFAGAVALLLPVLVSPLVLGDAWTVRYAALALVIAAGLPALVALAWPGQPPAAAAPARLALALAGWAWLSALSSEVPAMSVFGSFLTGTGALFVTALAASWAVGRAGAGGEHAGLVVPALLVAAGANAAVAVLQTVFDLESMRLGLMFGRAPGLMGNPVFLGAFLAGAVWLALTLPARRWQPAALVLLGAGLQLSGSRLALATALLAVAWWSRVSFAARGRRVVFAGLALMTGLVVGAAVGAVGGSATGVGRLSDSASSGGLSMRTATWATAPAALAERPLLGHGPGRYGAASAPHRSLRLARIDGDRYYVDAHNLAVEHAVTLGLAGLVLSIALFIVVFRRAGPATPLGGFALILMATHLLQPQHVALTPLMLLALGGAAAAREADRDPAAPSTPPSRLPLPHRAAATALLAGAAMLAAGAVLTGAFWLEQARLDFDGDDARRGRRLVPPWPEPATLLARIHTFEHTRARQPGDAAAAIEWRREAVERDPQDPHLWNSFGDALATLGASAGYEDPHTAAVEAYRQALARDPHSVRALNGVGRFTADPVESARLLRLSLLVDPDQPDIRRLLARR